MPIQCPRCEYTTPADVSENVAIAIFNAHVTEHMPNTGHTAPTTTSATAPRGPKLARPKVDIGVSLEEWNVFARRWDAFVLGSGLDATSCTSQLFECAGEELGDDILKTEPAILTRPTRDLFNAMKNLAVIAVAPGVLRTELMQMHQDRDETFRTFAAKVRGKAETCGYKNHDCREQCDFTQSMVKDVLVAGIFDLDIRREVLSTDNILRKPTNDIISLVEAKETARNALPSTSAAVSQFKRNQRKSREKPPTPGKTQTVPCPGCGKAYALFTEGSTGWNSKAHLQCIDCFRKSRKQGYRRGYNVHNPKSTPSGAANNNASNNAEIGGTFAQIATISAPSSDQQLQSNGGSPPTATVIAHAEVVAVAAQAQNGKSLRLPHQIFSKGEWRHARFRNHPKVNLSVSVNQKVQGLQDEMPTRHWFLNQRSHRLGSPIKPVVIR